MTAADPLAALLLPGVSVAKVRASLERAAGNELASGKFASPQSSSALAVNGFGPFLDAPESLPPFPGLGDLDWPARAVAVERQLRFPWSGGRHPWLDAVVETEGHLIGVESKRFEPFRDAKAASLSPAYDRDVWGEGMAPWCALRDRLRANPRAFVHLDAAQLVKHAFALVTQARRQGRQALLLYLFAEPQGERPVPAAHLERHRAEVSAFAEAVAGSAVRFAACSWREWLAGFPPALQGHAGRVLDRFAP